MTHQIPMIFYPEQRVRVYRQLFNGGIDPGRFFEGIVEGPDKMFPYIIKYRIGRVHYGMEMPHSWRIGTLSDFNTNYPTVELV